MEVEERLRVGGVVLDRRRILEFKESLGIQRVWDQTQNLGSEKDLRSVTGSVIPGKSLSLRKILAGFRF